MENLRREISVSRPGRQLMDPLGPTEINLQNKNICPKGTGILKQKASDPRKQLPLQTCTAWNFGAHKGNTEGWEEGGEKITQPSINFAVFFSCKFARK